MIHHNALSTNGKIASNCDRPQTQRREGNNDVVDLSTRSDTIGAAPRVPRASRSRGTVRATRANRSTFVRNDHDTNSMPELGVCGSVSNGKYSSTSAPKRAASDEHHIRNQSFDRRRASSGVPGYYQVQTRKLHQRSSLPIGFPNPDNTIELCEAAEGFKNAFSLQACESDEKDSSQIQSPETSKLVHTFTARRSLFTGRSKSRENLTDLAVQAQQLQSRRDTGLSDSRRSSIDIPRNIQDAMRKGRPGDSIRFAQTRLPDVNNQNLQPIRKKKPSYSENGLSSFMTATTLENSMSHRMSGSFRYMKNTKNLNRNVDEFNVNTSADGEKRTYQRYRLRCIVLTVGLSILMLGLLVGLYARPSSRVEDKEDSEVNVETTSNELGIPLPPVDIEARCSASNLPGSLSACQEVCLPASCCYPGFTGDTCFENARCSLYKPYCDVFYDAWIDGTEGVLRDVSDDIMDLCTGTEASNNAESSLRRNSATASSSEQSTRSLVRKRLRVHRVEEKSGKTHNANSTELATPSPAAICQQYCISARCCDAAVIDDPESSGFMLSPSGVYLYATNGEYAMTNCQVSNEKNVQLCSKYQQICSSDSDSIAKPSTTQTASMSTNATAPSRQPIAPASTSQPSKSSYSNTMPSTKPVVTSSQNAAVFSTRSPSQAIDTSSMSQPSQESTMSPTVNKPSVSAGLSSSTGNPPMEQMNTWVQNATENGALLSGQSIAPSSTSQPSSHKKAPTMSPTAHIATIQTSCASDWAKFLITSGDESARAECIFACLDGFCCFPDELGYTSMDSCYESNKQKCSEFLPCLILKGNMPQQDGDINTTNIENNVTSNTTEKEEANIAQDDDEDIENVDDSASLSMSLPSDTIRSF